MTIELVNDHVLIPSMPNWRGDVSLVRRWQTEIGAVVTGAEDRGAMRQVPRLELTFEPAIVTISQQEEHTARVMAALESGKAAVPLWSRSSDLATDATGTSATVATATWPWQIGDHVFFLDAGDIENPVWCVRTITAKVGLALTLNSALPQTFKTGSLIWPMIFGKLSADAQSFTTPRTSLGRITLKEQIGSTRSEASGAPVYLTRPIFTAPVNWIDGVTRELLYDLRELQIGFGAEVFAQLQTHTIHGFDTVVNLQTETAIRELDNFTAALKGRLHGFWFPAPVEAMNIVAGTSTTVFEITDQGLAETWQNHPSIHLWFTRNGISAASKIASVDGTEVTLETALPFTPDAETMVSRLHYVRLATDAEDVQCRAEWFESRRLRVVELPLEYAEAETGESPVYLYHIWLDTTPNVQHFRYTSFASNITSGGNVFTAKPITHGGIKNGITGQAEKVTIEAVHEVGHPFLFGFPYPPQRAINVQILETTFAAPDTVTVLFTGQVEKAPRRGRKITASCVSLLDLDSQRLPDALIGPRCAFQVFNLDTCGLNRAAWQKTATVTVITDRVIRITHATAFDDVADQHYAFGWIECGQNAEQEVRSILSDIAISDTVREITLDLPLRFVEVNDTLTILPGCDGRWDTCRLKFGNDRFMGHVFVPGKNPTLVAVQQPVSQGGKK